MLSLNYLLNDFVRNESPPMRQVMKDIFILSQHCAKRWGINIKRVRGNSLALYAALTRYARDAFGCQRITNFIDERFIALSGGMSDEKKEEIKSLRKDLRDELENSGIRIPSENPYAHRRCAFLLYHLISQKPFFIAGPVNDDPEGERIAYFNAQVSTCVVDAALAAYGLRFFVFNKDTLRDLAHRTLSRSAIEAMTRYAIRPSKITPSI